MRKLLIPARLSSYLTIMEAVEWVAYRRYTIEISQEDADYYGDNYKRFSPTFNIKRVLPPTEKTELDKEIDAFMQDQVTRGLFNDKFDYARQNELYAKKKEEDILAEAEYKSQIEIAKHDLFVALKKGLLETRGEIYGRMRDGYNPSQWNEDEAWDDESTMTEDVEAETIKVIPPSYWKFEGIFWEKGAMRCPEGRYYIDFYFDDLVQIYPEKTPEYMTIEKRGGHFIYNDNTEEPPPLIGIKKSGRKPIVDWDSVHAYIAHQITLSDSKLSKQDSLAQEIKDWIAKEFKQDVGISTIKGKLKPYYALFQKE